MESLDLPVLVGEAPLVSRCAMVSGPGGATSNGNAIQKRLIPTSL